MTCSYWVHQSGKGYADISKTLDLNRPTARAVMLKRRTLGAVLKLPRSDWPAKVSPEAQPKIIQTITKDPEAASRELQAPLGSAFGMPQSFAKKPMGGSKCFGKVFGGETSRVWISLLQELEEPPSVIQLEMGNTNAYPRENSRKEAQNQCLQILKLNDPWLMTHS